MEWIRQKDLPNVYPISISHAKNLAREFRTQTDDGWIKDGKVVIIKKEVFENWWRNRGNQQSAQR